MCIYVVNTYLRFMVVNHVFISQVQSTLVIDLIGAGGLTVSSYLYGGIIHLSVRLHRSIVLCTLLCAAHVHSV